MKRAKGKPAGANGPAFGSGAGFGTGSSFGRFGAPDGGSSLSYLTEPPSFSAVSDPNVVVALKNVLKKDATTKAKGLEELVSYVQAHPFDADGGVEEAVLDVWVQIYSRVSIDNSRRVRELSHNLQLELMKSARKRMSRHIPKVVGPWLAGLYDRDRGVSRAANDGLSSFLNTPEKVSAFWAKCHAQILDYAIGAIQETADTLSDERTTTKDDAEAKHARVTTASLSLVLGLLQRMNATDIQTLSDRYDDYFGQDGVWATAAYPDATVRKTVYQLSFACIDRKLPYGDSTKLRQAIVTGGLKTNQAGSALEYVRALTKLASLHPDIWQQTPKQKKAPLTMLQTFIAKGSQGSPPKFWEYLDQLLSILPADLISSDSALSLMTSIKSGITNREEPRTNTSFAWKCYIDTAKRLLENLDPDAQLAFAEIHLFPLSEEFLFSNSERPAAIPLGPNAMTIFVEAYLAIVRSSPRLVSASAEHWNRLASTLCTQISGSLPEVSKEFQASQEQVAEKGRRWFALVGHIDTKLQAAGEDIPNHTATPSAKIVSQCISLLESRNMKPFGAAGILEYALSTSPHTFDAEPGQQMAGFLRNAAEEEVGKVIESSSSSYILSCLRIFGGMANHQNEFRHIWSAWTEAVLALPVSTARDGALTSLVSQKEGARLAQNNPSLQEDIAARVLATVDGEAESWELLEAAAKFGGLAPETSERLVRELLALTEKAAHPTERALKALEIIAKSNPKILSQNDTLRTALVAQSLSLSEISNAAVSTKAVAIRSILDSTSDGKVPVAGIIQSNLERVGPQSLGIDTLVDQAKKASSSGVPLEDVFPSTNAWMSELTPFLEQPVDPSLSITNILGGAASLVNPASELKEPKSARDRDGRSIPARMALYTSQLLASGLDLTSLPREFQVELFYLQSLTVQLVSDQITTLAENGLWKSLEDAEAFSQAEELVTSSRAIINERAATTKWWTDSDDNTSAVIRGLVELTLEQSKELTPRGLHSARALGEILQSVAAAHGVPPALEERLFRPEILKSTPTTVLPVAALITGFGQALQASKAISNFANRLVSDVAGASAQAEKTSAVLVLLTLAAQIYERGELPVANNRIVFAVKQITSWLDDRDELSSPLSAEICRALTQLLPCMKDVYGSYWEAAIGFCTHLWANVDADKLTESLPFIHASLRLVKTLETLEEPNDDLPEALQAAARSKAVTQIELLKLPRERKSQPLDIVDAMLCREVEKVDARYIPDLSDIFGLVASESRDIQTAAFGLLHKTIPAQQEQKSVDVLLDKTDARLPDELLSLLLDAPTLERYPDELLTQFPSSIRSYLLSWRLVFDAYSTSSFKIRNDFTENLKTDNYVAPLLDFMFDVLGHSAAHPLSLDKENLTPQHISDYDIKLADSEAEEKSMQWLLIHLFYLTLKYIPGLFRSWYIDCRSKQTRIAVEAWTTKYFSPLIIADALDDVQAWADSQEAPAADEQELVVKVSKPAKEVTAGYEVDEVQASIVIRVPPSYPIEGVTVAGLHRVAVTERKWQSWIMTTQGVITFSNGNIIDGLQAFRRNIVGALKGQSECAICYSIISTDKRIPDKRCTTCKNLFHRSCLYKWFQSSNQNTCPLCRNPIDYLGADTAKRRQ